MTGSVERRVNRRTLLGAAVAAPALALGGGLGAWALASRAGNPTPRPVRPVAGPGVLHLSFWGGWTGPDGGTMQRLVRAFNAETPDVQVTLTLYNWDLIFDRWQAEFDGGNPPDIVGIHATDVAEYAARGMLREVARDAAHSGLFADDFFPRAWQLCRVEGGLYAVPLDVHPLGLYIDARAARAAGLDVNRPPSDGRELLAWAGRLTDARRGAWGYAAPAGDVECFRQWYSLLYQYGGQFMDARGERCLAAGAPGIAAYKVLRDAVASRQVAMPGEGSVDADFLAGRLRMYAQGPWYIVGARQAGIDLVTAPFPRIGPRAAVWANSHVLGVVNTQDSARSTAALRFIAWVDRHALWWAGAGQLPARNAARARLDRTALWPYLRPFVAQLPSVVYEPNLRVHNALFAEQRPAPVIDAAHAVMSGRAGPADALRVMSARVDSIVATGTS